MVLLFSGTVFKVASGGGPSIELSEVPGFGLPSCIDFTAAADSSAFLVSSFFFCESSEQEESWSSSTVESC
jgi:hypothetical protein